MVVFSNAGSINTGAAITGSSVSLTTTSGAGMTIDQDITASTGSLVLNSNDVITMSGGTTTATATSGIVDIDAGGNVTLTSVVSGDNTASAINITTSGQIIDGDDTAVDIIATTSGAVVTLDASGGIGSNTGVLSESQAIDTNVLVLAIDNDTSGHVQINETDGVDLNLVSNAGGGSIVLEAGGAIGDNNT